MPRRIKTARKTVAALVAAASTLAACEGPDSAGTAPVVQAPKAGTAAVVAPPPLPALGRAQLLEAIDAAASAHAAGAAVEAKDLAGRRFVVRQAFGCRTGLAALGPQAGLASWSQARTGEAIDIALTPADWTRAPVIADAGSPWEAVEGFWIDRPWMRAEGCPALAVSEAEAEPVAPHQTAGLASVFEDGGSRVLRRDGKPFRHTLRGKDVQAPVGGLRLVLEGRFTAFPDGAAITCRTTNASERPLCIAAAQIDRVAFEDAEGTVLSEWRLG